MIENKEYIEMINSAAKYIKNKLNGFKPEVCIVLGSGLGDLADTLENKIEIPYKDIPNFVSSTVVGHKGQFVAGLLNGKPVICMQGRFHFYEGYELRIVTLPVRVMKTIGVEKLIVTNAAGGVNLNYNPGDLMIITDHINLTGQNPLIGHNLDEFGTRFPDMSTAYDRKYIELAENNAKKLNINYQKGVYAWLTGPTYETPAEIKYVRNCGADAVGMSTVPEVIVARHSQMKVLGISCITNMAAGILNQPLNHEEVTETANRVKSDFMKLITNIVGEI